MDGWMHEMLMTSNYIFLLSWLSTSIQPSLLLANHLCATVLNFALLVPCPANHVCVVGQIQRGCWSTSYNRGSGGGVAIINLYCLESATSQLSETPGIFG